MHEREPAGATRRGDGQARGFGSLERIEHLEQVRFAGRSKQISIELDTDDRRQIQHRQVVVAQPLVAPRQQAPHRARSAPGRKARVHGLADEQRVAAGLGVEPERGR